MRIGVIVPSVNTVLEPDVLGALPSGVAAHFTRILNSEDTEEQLAGMRDEAGRAAWLLSHTGARAIAFGCTSGTFLKGLAYDRDVVRLMAGEAHVACVTTSGCAVDALRAVGARRVQLFTPYAEWLTRRGEAFLKECGFDVVGIAYRDLAADKMCDVAPEEIAAWAATSLEKKADAIFISCTNFRAMAAADAIERQTGVPVVTSNQATLWGTLRAAGVTARIRGYGRLLADAAGVTA